MEVINPLNRVPDTEETMVMACRCVCDTGSATMKESATANPEVSCACQCQTGNVANNVANYTAANTAS